jgi:formate hydrogenlyase subunit 4
MSPSWVALAWGLLAPLLLLGVAPLLDGVARQVRARLESRAGPPLHQGYLDLAKLAEKSEVSAGANRLADGMPWLALAAACAAGALLPVAGTAPLGFAGDALALLYLLGLSSVALVLAGSATGSAFGFVGGNREMLLLLSVEPVVAGALFVLALKAGSFRLDAIVAWQAAHGPGVSGVLAAGGMLLALLAYMGRVPFDLAEAEQELMGGSLIEFGGARLALLHWTLSVRGLVVAWLAAELFAPTVLPFAFGLPVAALKALLVFGVAAALSVMVARMRLDHARAYLFQVALLMGSALVFALIGA